MVQSSSNSNKEFSRKNIRFSPEPGVAAVIDINDCTEENFDPQYNGLVVEYSPMGGCGLVVMSYAGLIKEKICRVKIGELPAIRAEVVWNKALAEDVDRCGLKFLE